MTQYKIINAPSKLDVIVAFFDKPNNGTGRRSVFFTTEDSVDLKGNQQIEVVINEISWEDGSGESWCFEGYCKTDVGQPQNWIVKVKGWFRTSDRKGWIDIDAPAQSNASKKEGQVDPSFRKMVDDIVARRK